LYFFGEEGYGEFILLTKEGRGRVEKPLGDRHRGGNGIGATTDVLLAEEKKKDNGD